MEPQSEAWNAAPASQIVEKSSYIVASDIRKSEAKTRRKCLVQSRLQAPHRTRRDQDQPPSKDP